MAPLHWYLKASINIRVQPEARESKLSLFETFLKNLLLKRVIEDLVLLKRGCYCDALLHQNVKLPNKIPYNGWFLDVFITSLSLFRNNITNWTILWKQHWKIGISLKVIANTNPYQSNGHFIVFLDLVLGTLGARRKKSTIIDLIPWVIVSSDWYVFWCEEFSLYSCLLGMMKTIRELNSG